jgi:hypothetical protein
VVGSQQLVPTMNQGIAVAAVGGKNALVGHDVGVS